MRTPVNISIHTTNSDLRVKMTGNPRAGEVLDYMYRLDSAGISMNCQLVLCPGINDGDELIRSLDDLSKLNSIESIACVPVGLTKYCRNGLRLFSKTEAAKVIETINAYNNVYAADEFYLTAKQNIPEYAHYGAFLQYENGVGMLAHFKEGVTEAYRKSRNKSKTANTTTTSIVTGAAAESLLRELTVTFRHVRVYGIRNDFFGESITVSGLITGGDIIAQLTPHKHELGAQLLIGANTLNADGLFLDNLTPQDLEEALDIKVKIIDIDGAALYEALA
jgi:NifB/MoaA-like Fe-S oxidoreductase